MDIAVTCMDCMCADPQPDATACPCNRLPITSSRRPIMAWSKPEFIDWRFGFEITLYIANR